MCIRDRVYRGGVRNPYFKPYIFDAGFDIPGNRFYDKLFAVTFVSLFLFDRYRDYFRRVSHGVKDNMSDIPFLFLYNHYRIGFGVK